MNVGVSVVGDRSRSRVRAAVLRNEGWGDIILHSAHNGCVCCDRLLNCRSSSVGIVAETRDARNVCETRVTWAVTATLLGENPSSKDAEKEGYEIGRHDWA